MTALLLLLTFPVATFMTAAVRRYALKKSILDIPNERSSHLVPTPRGGGIGIVATFLGVLLIAVSVGIVSSQLAIAICGGGLIVAVVGWIDDRKSIAASLRFVIHALAAVWYLMWSGGLPSLSLGPATLFLGFPGQLLVLTGIVWLINLFNFMDGIDGLAALEAVWVAAVGGLLAFSSGLPDIGFISLVLSLASLGFLVWNWPPAKIFMGDVGSGFLGYMFATLASSSEKQGGLPLVVWMMVLSVFIVDATATLLRRISNGENPAKPHRDHLYQLAVRAGLTHKRVSLMAMVINVLLLPIVLVVASDNSRLLVGAGLTFGVMFLLHWLLSDRYCIPARGDKCMVG